MKYYSTTFFCDKEEGPKVYIREDKQFNAWPVTIDIGDKTVEYSQPNVVFHLASHADLVNFVYSVNKAYADYLKPNN